MEIERDWSGHFRIYLKGKINLLYKCIVWVYNKGHKQIEMIGK